MRLLIAIGFMDFCIALLIAVPLALEDTPVRALTLPPSVHTVALPLLIRIPSVAITARLEPLGLTTDGALDAPVSPADAGWYEGGPRPGAPGNAVVVGHSGWRDDIPAAFDNLKNLEPDELIYIDTRLGTTEAFIVRSWRFLAENESTKSIFVQTGETARLRLITCSGDWDERTKSYSRRLIVFADKVE